MKQALLFITLVWLGLSAFAQTPQAIKYQTVARNNAGEILASQNISFRMTILQGELPGTVVYTETHTTTSNTLGLVNLEIGNGEKINGTFYAIDQEKDFYYVKVEIDAYGGNNFALLETTRLNSNSKGFSKEKDGFFSDETKSDFVYTIPGDNIPSLMANVNEIKNPKNKEKSFPEITEQQVIVVPQGWSGLSSYLTPDNTNIENLFLPYQNQLIILYNQQGVYYPAQQLNTLVNWDAQSGYIAKFNQETSIEFTGQPVQSRVLSLTAGWNLIPVLSECPANVATLFGNLDVVVVKEVAGWKLYWPEMGINSIDELLPGNAYYILMNSPAEITFPNCGTPPWQCGDLLVDTRDGKSYTTVQIGDQCWMAENLNIGTKIDGINEQSNNTTIEKYCYNNSEAQCDVYGGLYQWNEMMQYSTTPGVQGICPIGWHLPTDAEWTTLTSFLDGQSVAGGKMKEAGTSHWISPNTGATNSSGFTGLPGGNRYGNGSFGSLSNYGFWWSSTEDFPNFAWSRYLYYYNAEMDRFIDNTSYGYSVRCLKDETATSQLEVTPANQDVPYTAGTTTFEVTSNSSWNVSENADWLTVTPTNGNLNQTLTINYDANTTTLTRFGEITITAAGGNPVVVVTVTQQEGQQTWACGQPLTDSRDGQTYTTVQIGDQCWMKQNLNIGTRIDGSSNQTNNDIIEKYCYSNTEANCTKYGGLYQWDEMMQYTTTVGVKGICPSGWHLPTDDEWTTLTNYVSSKTTYRCNNNVDFIAKSLASTTDWLTYTGTCTIGENLAANNATSFTAMPGGYLPNDGWFHGLSGWGYSWSSTQNDGLKAWVRVLVYNEADVHRYASNKSNGFSVRCLKDETTTSQIEVTPANQDVPYTAGTTTFEVTSNSSWNVSENADWFTVTPTNGNLNQTLTVNYDANTSTSTRIGEITLTAAGGDPVVVVTVTQQAQQAFACGQPLIDNRDGHTYTTVQIGDQCWMAENLNVGTRINGENQQFNNGTLEKYCYYNLETNCDVYGGLYQWNEAMQYTSQQGLQGICSEGWHLPTDSEWTILTSYLGGESLAGGKMKATGTLEEGTGLWFSPNTGATNSNGFTGLPGAYRYYIDGDFYALGSIGLFWSSTEENSAMNSIWIRHLSYEYANINRTNFSYSSGLSVRCIKDETTTSQLEVTPTNQSVAASAGTTTFEVTSNTSWTVSESVSWLSVDPLGGSNNGTLTVSYDANLDTEARTGQITITAAGGAPVVNVTLTQAGMVPTLAVTPPNQNASEIAGTTTFDVTSNTSWTVSESVSWLSVDPLGGSNNGTLTVSYDANLVTEARIGQITITAAGGTPVVVVTVSQTGMVPTLTVTPANQGVSSDAGITTFEVTSNTSWTVAESVSWFTVSPASGSNNGTVTVTYDENLVTESRTGQITITAAGGVPVVNVTLTQAGIVPVLTVTPPNQNVTAQAGTTTFEVTSNTSWTVTENETWFSVSPMNGNNNGTLTVTYDENLATESRIGQITITATGGAPVVNVTVTQAGIVPVLTVTPPNQDVTTLAGTTTFEVTSNTSWTVTENETWFSVSPMNGSNNETLTVTYEANTSTDPRVGQITVAAGGGTPVFTATVSQAGLTQQWSCGQNITDPRDSQSYTTVQIGDQCWMAENLNVGTRIDGINEQTNNGIIEKYCNNNLEANCDEYGGLYQWKEMMGYSTTPGVQGICPEGWHLPTDTKWTTLTTFISSQPEYLCNSNTNYIAKALAATTNWYTSNAVCAIGNNLESNNATGFSALPGGGRSTSGSLSVAGDYGNWWSSSQQVNSSNAWCRYLIYSFATVNRQSNNKSLGFSVRCLKDN